MKSLNAWLGWLVAALLLLALGVFAIWQTRLHLAPTKPDAPVVVSREAVISRIQQLNRLETTAFQIDSIIRTERAGHWYSLWQDRQKGLFLVRGSVIAGADLSKLTPSQVHTNPDGRLHIDLPPVSIFQVNLDKIEVYDLKSGTLGLAPPDPSVFQVVQEDARNQILTRACEGNILARANEEAQKHITGLFALTPTPVTVSAAPLGPCVLPAH